MNHDEDVKRAAVAIHEQNAEELEAIITEITTADIDPGIPDAGLERELESRRKEYEQLTDEEAVSMRRGSAFLGFLIEWIAERREDCAALRLRWKEKCERYEAFFARLMEQKMNEPLVGNDFFHAAFFFLMAAAAVLADAHLLNFQISEILGSEAPNTLEQVGNALAAFLIVMGLAIATHKACDETTLRSTRITIGSIVCLFAVSLGVLRTYSTSTGDEFLSLAVGAVVWTLVTLSAPVVAACCVKLAEPCLRRFIDNMEVRLKWRFQDRDIRKRLEREVEMVSETEGELRRLLDEFPASRRALIAESEGEVAKARGAKRWRRAEVVRAKLFWLFLKRQKPSSWNWSDILLAVGVVLAAGFLLMGSRRRRHSP